jgi:hypothetical protein
MSRLNILFIARDIERALIETTYAEIIRSGNVEYNDLVGESSPTACITNISWTTRPQDCGHENKIKSGCLIPAGSHPGAKRHRVESIYRMNCAVICEDGLFEAGPAVSFERLTSGLDVL